MKKEKLKKHEKFVNNLTKEEKVKALDNHYKYEISEFFKKCECEDHDCLLHFRNLYDFFNSNLTREDSMIVSDYDSEFNIDKIDAKIDLIKYKYKINTCLSHLSYSRNDYIGDEKYDFGN